MHLVPFGQELPSGIKAPVGKSEKKSRQGFLLLFCPVKLRKRNISGQKQEKEKNFMKKSSLSGVFCYA